MTPLVELLVIGWQATPAQLIVGVEFLTTIEVVPGEHPCVVAEPPVHVNEDGLTHPSVPVVVEM